METLLLSNYGLKWNTAQELAPGEVYAAISRAYRQHLEALESQQADKSLRTAASLLRGVLEGGQGGGQGNLQRHLQHVVV